MKTVSLIISLLFLGFVNAQSIDDPVSWKLEVVKTSDSEADVKISAKILKGWQLYSNDFDPNLGPMVTEFQYTVSSTFELIGGTIPQNSHRKYDDLWGGEYAYFEHNGQFVQKIKVLKGNPEIQVAISYQVCNTEDGKCIPFEVTLKN